VLATAAAMTAAAAQEQGSCGQIRAACMAAGFVQGAARDGIGLQVHCIAPIMEGRTQPAQARRPLPKVGARLVEDCKASGSRFARALLPSQAMAPPRPLTGPPPAPPTGPPPAPASGRDAGAPGQEVVVRPPMPTSSQQRSALAALPPDYQPETGPAKPLPPHLRRATVDYPSKEAAGTIVIDTANTYLYLVLGGGKAVRYGIGVGRDGFTWSGAEKVTRMAEWPDWR
jgi:hypothetical protein